jgi:transcriptional regulator with XRE-family HTH domain
MNLSLILLLFLCGFVLWCVLGFLGGVKMDMFGEKITEIDTIVGMKLKEHRESKGLSQSDMGKLIGSSQTRWAKLESGKTSLNVANMYEITVALEIEPGKLFSEIDEFKKELESDGWIVKPSLEDGDTDLLRSFSSMTSSALSAFGLSSSSTASIAGAAMGVGAFIGGAALAYFAKKK